MEMLVEANLRSSTGDGADDVNIELAPQVLGVVHGLVSKLSTCFMSDDVPVIADQELTSIKRSCPLATSDSATPYESYTQ